MNRVRSMPHDHILLSAKTAIMHAIFKIRSCARTLKAVEAEDFAEYSTHPVLPSHSVYWTGKSNIASFYFEET